MDLIKILSELLISSFLIATLLNLAITKPIFKEDFKLIQYWLGLGLILGLGLNYILMVSQLWTNRLDPGALFTFKPWNAHFGYNLMLIYPLIVLAFNLPYQLRTHKIVAILSMLMFLPRMFEFFLVYTVSDVTFSTMNAAYTDPMVRIFIAGPVLYGLTLMLEKFIMARKRSQRQASGR